MKEWDPKSQIKQDSEKSIQGSCNKHNHDNAEQVGCLETTENIAINRSDTAKTKTTEKEANDDSRSRKQRDIYEEDSDDWTTKETIDRKAIDPELEIDDEEYWDTLSHIEEENEMIRDDDSETDEEIFWDSPSEPEENTEPEPRLENIIGSQKGLKSGTRKGNVPKRSPNNLLNKDQTKT